MSSRTRTLLLTGCFFVAGLFAPPPLVRRGPPAAAPKPVAAAARIGGSAPAPRELVPSVAAALTYARR